MTGDGFGVSLKLKERLTVNNNWLNRQLHDPRGLLFGILIFLGWLLVLRHFPIIGWGIFLVVVAIVVIVVMQAIKKKR
jgi:tetrahydromethanopterin S-methyltransferase subunit E